MAKKPSTKEIPNALEVVILKENPTWCDQQGLIIAKFRPRLDMRLALYIFVMHAVFGTGGNGLLNLPFKPKRFSGIGQKPLQLFSKSEAKKATNKGIALGIIDGKLLASYQGMSEEGPELGSFSDKVQAKLKQLATINSAAELKAHHDEYTKATK